MLFKVSVEWICWVNGGDLGSGRSFDLNLSDLGSLISCQCQTRPVTDSQTVGRTRIFKAQIPKQSSSTCSEASTIPLPSRGNSILINQLYLKLKFHYTKHEYAWKFNVFLKLNYCFKFWKIEGILILKALIVVAEINKWDYTIQKAYKKIILKDERYENDYLLI